MRCDIVILSRNPWEWGAFNTKLHKNAHCAGSGRNIMKRQLTAALRFIALVGAEAVDSVASGAT
jgi:hypothetical protein